MKKIMIVDDHSLIRNGLRLLLKNNPDFYVSEEAATAEEALSKLKEQIVDIMILDISMPGMSGLTCITQAKQLYPQLRIIMLSMHEDENYISKALQLGANAYIPKASADSELLDAIETVASGRFYLSKNAEQSLLTFLFTQPDNNKKTPLEILSPREIEVFNYIVHGYTITEISKILYVSVKTVDTHKTKIMEKLNCNKRSELVSIALQYNILQNQQ